MRAIALIGCYISVMVLLAAPASAQAKDPFRPPPGASSTTSSGGTGTGATAPVGPQPPPATGSLPRTGEDFSVLFMAAVALIAAGSSLRLAGRALAP